FHQFVLALLALLALAAFFETDYLANQPVPPSGSHNLLAPLVFDLAIGAMLLVLPFLLLPLQRWVADWLLLSLVVCLQSLPFYFLLFSKLFFEQTGVPLDLGLMAYVIGNLGDLGGLLVNSVDALALAALTLPVLLLAASWQAARW